MGRAEDAILRRQQEAGQRAQVQAVEKERENREAYRKLLGLIEEWTPQALAALERHDWPAGGLIPTGSKRVKTGMFSSKLEVIREAAVSVGGIAPEGKEIASWGTSYLFSDGTWRSNGPGAHSRSYRGTFHGTIASELDASPSLEMRACVEARLRGVPEVLRSYAIASVDAQGRFRRGPTSSFEIPQIRLPSTGRELRGWVSG